MRRRTKPTKPKVDAKPPIARKALKSEGSRVHDLDKHLAEAAKREAEALKREAEALEQQTATAEILRVMSSSLAQLQPVLDAIAERAARLCDASNGTIILSDGEALRMEAHYGPLAGQIGINLPIDRRSVSGRAFIVGHPLQVDDMSEAADFPLGRQNAARFGIRTFLAVPLVREAVPIGLITMQRTEVRPFSDKQIELVKTFADQAVIAIENVRLFTELQQKNGALTQAHAQVSESLEQQTATSEILGVISSSPSDLAPVFDTIAESAVRLCDVEASTVTRFDGEWVHLVAVYGSSPEGVDAVRRSYPVRGGGASAAARSIRDRAIAHIPDVLVDEEYGPQEAAVASGFRAALAVPMLRERRAIGAIGIGRSEPGEFSERQVELLKTFADQAVIAIENVRLFTELQASNRELTTALDTQTATSDILRVISRSPNDVQPVFDSIAASALRLCDAKLCTTFTFDGELIHLVASHHVTEEGAAAYRDAYPSRPGRASGTHRAILTRTIVHIPDIREDPEYELRALARANDYGCVLAVPMLRDGHPVGAITVGREAARPFPSEQIELLKTFADQAVIAIENVRLFTELQTRNRELTTALDTQTATADILRVISRSQTDVQPVFDAIVDSAMRLLHGISGALTRVSGDQIMLAALTSTDDTGDATVRSLFPLSLHSDRPQATVIRGRVPLNVADAHTDARWPE